MDLLYILLGGKAVASDADLSPAAFVAYGDKEAGGGPASVSWSATSPRQNGPLAYLTEQARKAMWRTEGGQILTRYNAANSMGGWLGLDPKTVAEADLMQIDRSGAKSQLSQANAPVLRDLQRIARQIVGRKAVFVFPKNWPGSIAAPAAGLVGAMVKEVCAHFRYDSGDEELPWAFLSLSADTGGQSLLGDFIRKLHHEMLAATSGIKIADWRRKGGAILLSGPTGSGKSYAVRLLAGMEYGAPLIEINLAAISDELLESRMRGYEPGTFTGADRKGRKGWFEEADGGVLFLDEFQSVSLAAQVQLLDVLSAISDDIYIAHIGADHKRSHHKVKVILAINEDIEILLREKRLRKDLYYRVRFIQGFPALKERLAPNRDPHHRYLRGMLASYRWKSLRTIEELCRLNVGLRGMARTFFPIWQQEALSALAEQEWEGNFRELERVAFDLFHLYDDRHEQNDYTRMDNPDDSRKPQKIGKAEVEIILKPWHAPASINEATEGADGMTARKREKLKSIQEALRESGFIIEKTLKSQPYIKSRPTLRNYLRDNIEHLDANVRNDSRVIRFLDR